MYIWKGNIKTDIREPRSGMGSSGSGEAPLAKFVKER
jgi:hypothetical protein